LRDFIIICYTFLKLNLFSFFYLSFIILYYPLLSFIILIMVLTIEQLIHRIQVLETHILLLLDRLNTKNLSPFKLFQQHFIPHVRSNLFRIHFYHTGNNNFQPKFSDIIKEISAMWNDTSHDEKLHWARIHTTTNIHS